MRMPRALRRTRKLSRNRNLQKQARKQIAAVAIGLFRSSLKGPNLVCYQLVAANLRRENQTGKRNRGEGIRRGGTGLSCGGCYAEFLESGAGAAFLFGAGITLYHFT